MRQFLATESGSAGLLLIAAVAALVWSNSPVADTYDSFWSTSLSISLADWTIDHSIRYWIDEALMATFFFVIGILQEAVGNFSALFLGYALLRVMLWCFNATFLIVHQSGFLRCNGSRFAPLRATIRDNSRFFKQMKGRFPVK